MKLALIGGGTMAEAMIHGALEQRLLRPEEIAVGEPDEARRSALRDRYAVAVTARNTEAIDEAPLVVLAVKPQMLATVLPELRNALNTEQTVLSIMAGVTIGTLLRGLEHANIIRAMPNTPAQIGHGTSVWTASSTVSDDMREATKGLLGALGTEVYVADEHLLDMATAINGSGPAYVFRFIEALIEGGVYLGMSRDLARTLVLETLLGSTLLAKETGKHPAELRDMVTSPGGTTAEALMTLEQQGFAPALTKAVAAAYEKSTRLGDA